MPVSAPRRDVRTPSRYRPIAAAGWHRPLAVLAAALALPVLGAPGSLVALPAPATPPEGAPTLRQAAAAALPFERPGMSFPGSAFYYLDDPEGQALVALPSTDPRVLPTEGGLIRGARNMVVTPARPFRVAGSGHTRVQAQECLAEAVWYEAASESEAGQRAVAQVVLNRVAHPAWPASVCGVVFQGSERRTGCQFTFTCDGSRARRPGGASWARAQRIAAAALAGSVYAPVGQATHYHTLWVDPVWATRLDTVGTIGAHRFYSLRGAAGTPGAFVMAHAGVEAAPPQRAAHVAPAPATSDPGPALAARAVQEEALETAPVAPVAPAPDTAVRASGQLKPQYARAGQWKVQPQPAPSLVAKE